MSSTRSTSRINSRRSCRRNPSESVSRHWSNHQPYPERCLRQTDSCTSPPDVQGSLETADGRAVKVDGWITTNLELGSIDDDIEALVVPELKAELILGMRSFKEYECSLDFHCDNLWTGPKKGSIVPLHNGPRLSKPSGRCHRNPTPAAYLWP